MSGLDALAGELKGVFGKQYLLAGLLPAAILLFGLEWLEVSSLTAVLTLNEPAEKTAHLVESGVWVALVGLVFFAARTFFVRFAQTLEWLPSPLRVWLIRRKLVRRHELRHRRGRHELDANALYWALERNFSAPTWLPSGYEPELAERVAKLSDAARAELYRVGDGYRAVPLLHGKAERRVIDGLTAEYALAVRSGGIRPAAEAAWRALCERPLVREVLQGLSAASQRKVVRTWSLLARFSDPATIQPTVLGTRAAVLDRYAEQRYGIDTSVMLTRLWDVLGKDDHEALKDSRLTVEVSINLAVAMLAITAGIVIKSMWLVGKSLPLPGPPWRVLDFDENAFLLAIFAVVLAWTSYWGAVFAHDSHAEKVARYIDLRRFDLLRKLGFKLPSDVGEELELWKELARFWAQGKPLDPLRPFEPSKA